MKKLYCVICGKNRKFKNPKIYTFDNTLVVSITYISTKMKMKKHLKKKNQLRY